MRAGALALAAAFLMAAAAPGVRGGYSAGQAREGAQVYAAQCAMCHGERLEGSVEIPGLTGRFVANWAGRPVGDLLRYVETAMPQHAPGSLDPADSRRVVAFVLERNGYAPGGELGDAAGMRRILPAPGAPRD